MMDWREIASILRQLKDHENYFENGFAITTGLKWIGYVVLYYTPQYSIGNH